MISFWTIYKKAIKRATGETYNKSSNSFDKIIPFNLRNPYVCYSNMNEAEINEFLKNVKKLIKYRNEKF